MTDRAHPQPRPSDSRAAHAPGEGPAVRDPRRPEDDDGPEIAADDAGASAMAETAGRRAED